MTRTPKIDNPFLLPFEQTISQEHIPVSEPHTAVDDAVGDMSLGLSEKKEFVGVIAHKKRNTLFFCSIGFAVLAIVGRGFYVQVVKNNVYQSLAENNRSKREWVPAQRGIIYDANNVALVNNIPQFTALLRPNEFPLTPKDRNAAIARIATLLNIAPEDINQKMAVPAPMINDAIVLAEKLTREQASLLLIESATNKAVSVTTVARRQYLYTDQASSLAHILGYEGKPTPSDIAKNSTEMYSPTDLIGKIGLEYSYENVLRGTNGKKRIEIDSRGREKQVIAEDPSIAGKNIYLSIDLELQRYAEKMLQQELRVAGKRRGSVIVLNAKTGEVMAMVSLPSFDNNLFAIGISKNDFARLQNDKDTPLFPRAISASVASGSTFKLTIASAGIDEKIITPSTTVVSTGGLRIGKFFFPDWKAGGHGVTNVYKALAESVNTFFYILGGGYDNRPGLGPERIVAYAKKFGFGAKTGIDIPGEGSGFVPTPAWKQNVRGEPWYIGDTYHLAIGQGDLLVTPLQIAVMTEVIASGGKLIQPRLVKAIGSDGASPLRQQPVVRNPQVVSKEAVAVVQQGLRQTVTAGSARSLASLPFAVAAKTGTAQWSSSRSPHAWFTSFGPFDDPQLVVTVMIEEGGEGSTTAAPVAKEIYQWWADRLTAPRS